MDTQLLTLRYAPKLGAIDDAPLRALAEAHEILELREHFFEVQGLPHLLCVVRCRPRAEAETRPKSSAPERPAPEPARTSRSKSAEPPADLGPDGRQLYDTIRTWRAAEAERAGLPRYVVLTNRDVEAIVRRRPGTRAALREIPGIGKAKLEKYGEALLELLHPARNLDDPPAAAAEAEAAPALEVAKS